jgi:prepilin-type N-terminal cleavage/methylation domain-containing protein
MMSMSSIKSRLSSDRGFTLAETMIAMLLMTIVSIVFTSALVSTMSATRDLQGAAQSNDSVRLALASLDRELRSAERICEPTPGNAGDTLSFRTRAYVGTPPPSGYRDLLYQLNADANGDLTVLQKSDDGGTTWRTVVENVTNVARGVDMFENHGDVVTALPSQGKVVTVAVWVDADPGDRISDELATTEISGRNIWTPSASGC